MCRYSAYVVQIKMYVLFLFLLTVAYAENIDVINFKDNDTKECACVPYYQCSEDTGHLITDGSGLFDVRGFQSSPCTGYFDVCCNATLPVTTTPFPERPKGCGFQNPGSSPWSGALLYQDTAMSSSKYRCGVSLIHQQVVLTAAHCINGHSVGNGIWTVRIGHMIREVKKILIHPAFSSGTLQNDVSLLILKTPVDISEKVGLICIPPSSTTLGNTRCTVSAWSKKKSHTFLKMVKLPVVPKEKCLKSLRNTRLGEYFQLHHSFICAGGEGFKDTCGGDGGSPLVCPVPGQAGRYHQAGVVSWGIGCGENNTPGVYVNVPIFREWIDEEMVDNGFEIHGYRY